MGTRCIYKLAVLPAAPLLAAGIGLRSSTCGAVSGWAYGVKYILEREFAFFDSNSTLNMVIVWYCRFDSRPSPITIGKPITNAVCEGNVLYIRLADVKVRRYSSRDSFSLI
jgi:hypothetical protein